MLIEMASTSKAFWILTLSRETITRQYDKHRMNCKQKEYMMPPVTNCVSHSSARRKSLPLAPHDTCLICLANHGAAPGSTVRGTRVGV